MTSSDIVQSYLEHNYRIVIWPAIGDLKGPKEKGWPERPYDIKDYNETSRVGILLGTEVSPGRFMHDVDIDWAPGERIAMMFLPETDFVFGRASKKVSHCFYLTSEPLPTFRYEDTDKTCLIELRGTKMNGEVGFQTMVPPSIWSKDNKREPLLFVKAGGPTFIENASILKQRVCLTAITMLLARHFGKNGFGHEPRLAWAGFLLRASIPVDDLVKMGEAISFYTNNTEVDDVRRVVESTAQSLNKPGQKVKGGPALAKMLGAEGRAVISLINTWLGRDSDFLRNSDGGIIKDSQENIRRAITMCDVELSHHSFAERLLYQETGKPKVLLEDRQVNDLWLRIDRDYKFRPSKQFFDIVIENLAFDNSFHPVRDYLNVLTWDGVPRIDTWIATYAGGPDSAFHRAVSSIVLIAAVRRIYQPGCKYDEMLVLESKQGLQKSSALRALCPKDEWFSDDLPLNVDAKQIIERTLGKWIIEASDLAGKRKTEIEQLKATLSRQVDGPARMAYARVPVERPRQWIIIGTTNADIYLNDSTGARRFWPMKVGLFDVDGITRDRDQLWAEARVRERAGDSIRLPESLWEAAGLHQDERREVDAWEEIISDALSLLTPATTGRRQIAASLLWDHLGIEVARRDRAGAIRISELMQRLGFYRTRIRSDGRVVIGYASDTPEKLAFDEGE